MAKHENEDLPRRRYELNVRRNGIDLSKQNVWHALLACQVTTQQRSGPKSAVSRFLDSGSLAFDLCRRHDSATLREFFERELTAARLWRRTNIANHVAEIWARLEAGEWQVLLAQLETLRTDPTSAMEREVVRYLLAEKKYPGLGQKQSRNFIQWLGLSRYEIPLDSRVLKTMRELGANFVPSGSALTDEVVYLFVQDCLQQVATALEIYPCMLDACIFASFDGDEEEGAAGIEA